MSELDIAKRITDELISDAETGKSVLEASAQQLEVYLQQLQSELQRVSAERVHISGKIAQAAENIEMLKGKRAKLDTLAPDADTPEPAPLPDPIPENIEG